MSRWMRELENCRLCAWECGVDRLNEGGGVCRMKLPEVAYTNISQVTRSSTVTFLGCCFRCIYCNAYRLSQYPDPSWFYRGYVPPHTLAAEMMDKLKMQKSREIGVDAVSFTGGEPTINLPYIEEVVREVRENIKDVKVGFATNGFASTHSMSRIIDLSSRISFEIKAYDDEVHRALTGAPVEPVLKNAELLGKRGRNKIRTIRTVVIPSINDSEVGKIAEFIAGIDHTIPYKIIGFRPSFMLYFHPGPSENMMKKLCEKAKKKGLTNVGWSAYYPCDIPARATEISKGMNRYQASEAKLAAAYSMIAGCVTHPRNCGTCPHRATCPAMLMEPWSLQHKLKNS